MVYKNKEIQKAPESSVTSRDEVMHDGGATAGRAGSGVEMTIKYQTTQTALLTRAAKQELIMSSSSKRQFS
jgi:hypothetical protein